MLPDKSRQFVIKILIPILKVFLGMEDINFVIIEKKGNFVAYTKIIERSKTAEIYVNPWHPLFSVSKFGTLRALRNFIGVLLHEMLHKKYTNPGCSNSLLNRKPIMFPNLYHWVQNVVEDFTIEQRALLTLDLSDDTCKRYKKRKIDLVKLSPLKCLSTAIFTTWAESNPIQETESVLSQIRSAMIQFTDMGPLKPGSTLSEDAEKALTDICPMLVDAVWQSPKDRAIKGYDIYKIVEAFAPTDSEEPTNGTKGKNSEAQETLSEEEIQKMKASSSMRAQMRIVKRLLKRANKNKDGSSKPQTSDENNQPGDSSDDNGKGSSSEEKDPTASNENSKSGDPTNAWKSNGEKESQPSIKGAAAGSDSENDQSSESDSGNDSPDNGKCNNDADTDDGEDEDFDDSDDDGIENEENSVDSEKERTSGDGDDESSCSDESYDSHEGMDSEDVDSDLETDPFKADEEMQRSINDIERENITDTIDINEIIENVSSKRGDFSTRDETCCITDFNKLPEYPDNILIKNFTVTGVSDDTIDKYREVITENRAFISKFKFRLKKITDVQESREFSQSGNVNITRYAERGRTSLRIFEKRDEFAKKDAKIAILLDTSGSMEGNKINKAKEALACIVEGLTSIGIPVKVMTYQEVGNAIVHHHYIDYKKGLANKASIMAISCDGCNCDGYSIKFAFEQLTKGKTKHHMMIVITDGQPNSYLVPGAVQDTGKQVKNAKRHTKVIGIGVDLPDAARNTIQGFYKNTFVNLKNVEDLLTNLSKIILKEVASWE